MRSPQQIAAMQCFAALVVGAVVAVLVGCQPAPIKQERVEQFGPVQSGPPPEAPTMNYEDFAGLDPQTEITIDQEKRLNDLEFLVEKHDREIRSLNQIVRGIREVRIGEAPPEMETEE